MVLKEKIDLKKQKNLGSIILSIAGVIVAICGITLLVDNVMLFYASLDQYVTQGYPVEEVVKQLLPGQLLPGVIQAVALYGGLATLLFFAGSMNKKVSSISTLLYEVSLGKGTSTGGCNCSSVQEVEPIVIEETIVEEETTLEELFVADSVEPIMMEETIVEEQTIIEEVEPVVEDNKTK